MFNPARLVRFYLFAVVTFSLGMPFPCAAREFHVSVDGDDATAGSKTDMLRTIQSAADKARPGDIITVHEGVYRERVNPPRGGQSDEERIVYQAAPGENVVIKGSEVIKGWQKVCHDTWKVSLPNEFFGDFNPYTDRIHGDWFNPKGRVHHTGAVYLNGHWLTEAAELDEVLKPVGETPLWFTRDSGRVRGFLLNVSWLRPGAGTEEADRISADGFARQAGIQTAPCSEGGQCIGWIEEGDWVCHEDVDFGKQCTQVTIRAASPEHGGRVELRLGKPDGELIGTCNVSRTGDWQKWQSFKAKIKPTQGVKTLCLVFRASKSSAESKSSEIDESRTTIWAQFKDVDPNEAQVEINARQSIFYPEKPGLNYITVRGFTMEHAATPWAPPTAEQIGLIGTHWSKGWIIEDNVIRYSTCVGVTLGKYGDEWDNRSQSAEAYNRTIARALKNGWSGENIGHHLVKNNHISHCEQAGIVGSMGAVFSTIKNNEIHDIHVRHLFTGAEMAGIKIHASIDMLIAENHIHDTVRGIWLDWMAQGARVTRNLLYHNDDAHDLFVEVNHGPFLVDNNIFLSSKFLRDWSEGGTYVHNLAAGRVDVRPVLGRATPFHKPHSTEVAGVENILGGDHRFYNNIFTGHNGLSSYKEPARPVDAAGNVYLDGAQPCPQGTNALVRPDFDPELQLLQKPDGVYLKPRVADFRQDVSPRRLVTTQRLGRAAVPDLPYEQPDGQPYRLATDFFGKKRETATPFPGPFAFSSPMETGSQTLLLTGGPDKE